MRAPLEFGKAMKFTGRVEAMRRTLWEIGCALLAALAGWLTV